MTIFKNGIGEVVAYLPKVIVTDPASIQYEHWDQTKATYGDLCDDIIRGCDIGIEQLQTMRAEYEKRRVMNGMGVAPVFDINKG